MLGALASGEPVLGLVPEGPGRGAPGRDTIPRWFASVAYERELIDSDLPVWTDWTRTRALLYRDLPEGAIGVEAAQVERFGLRDLGVALDVYRNVWEGAYANVWLRLSPAAEVLPDVDVRLELFQAFAGSWEASGSYRRMDFDANDVDVVGVGLARYVGDWYLRGVSSVSTVAGRSTFSLAGVARRFLSPPREFLELSGGLGREAVIVGPGPAVELRHSRFLQARLQRFLSAHWGVAVAASYNRFEGTPVRRALSLGLITRF
jgi:YaiO family outer membrane protein